MTIRHILATAALAIGLSHSELSADPIVSETSVPTTPSFDIQRASITRDGSSLVFRIDVARDAGAETPESIGQLNGSTVYSYVWPTSLDPSAVGFSEGVGLLAFAVTSHPDFDDTPLFDEDGDGVLTNDGRVWHSHWVVLSETDECGEAGLKVRDIERDETLDLPPTWPGLPILIDSPGWSPVFTPTSVEVRVPFARTVALEGISFDGVTAALRVNANAHVPLLCVSGVFDIASGDLSAPGRVE